LYFLWGVCACACLTPQTLKVQSSCSYKNSETHTLLMSMAGEQGDRFSSVTIPLLDDEKLHQVNGSDEALVSKTCVLHTPHVGNTSFFMTCFHLINALSGLFACPLSFFLTQSFLPLWCTLYCVFLLEFWSFLVSLFGILFFSVQLYSLALPFGSVLEHWRSCCYTKMHALKKGIFHKVYLS